MASDLTVEIVGLINLKTAENLLRGVPVAAQRAINRTANFARAESARRLRTQLNFPARYLSGKDGKIDLVPATPGRLQAVLSAESRPRSLARFITGRAIAHKKGVKVQVRPGAISSLPGAFLLGLGAGEDSLTILAIRSPSRPRTAFKPRPIGNGLWSLYGPSVAQALISAQEKGIWPAMEAELLDRLEQEFLRQVDLAGKASNGTQ